MTDAKAALITALNKKQDRYAAELIAVTPSLVDEDIISIALANGCCRVIRFLRKNDLITAEGGKRRQERQLNRNNELIAAANDRLPEIEAALEALRRSHGHD